VCVVEIQYPLPQLGRLYALSVDLEMPCFAIVEQIERKENVEQIERKENELINSRMRVVKRMH
jgi:hypothetical protein